MLQACLNEKSDTRLKNIVSTIQKKQNEIIRSNMFKPLIVQGEAGSGKTTVAIHRIAYLIYTYEKEFNPEEFVIIAPNKFFLGYIKDTLPDLGVENVRQYTIEDLTKQILNNKIEIEDFNKNLIRIVEKQNEEIIEKTTRFKGSFEFKEIVDQYLEIIEQNILNQRDFKINDIKLFSYEKLQRIIKENSNRYSLKTRIERLKLFLINKIENNIEEVIDTMIKKRKYRISHIDSGIDEKEYMNKRIAIFEEYEKYISLLSNRKIDKIVNEYIKEIKIPTSIESLKQIINNESLMKSVDKDIKELMVKEQKNRKIEYEDIPAILHLQYKLHGLENKMKLRHIIIDEAQDFSEFLFYSLNEILEGNKSLTILGDLAQGIYEYRGINNWDTVNKLIFNNEAKIEYLKESYRTTYEIMNQANKILEPKKEILNIQLANPVTRDGEAVEYIKEENQISKILELIKKEKQNGNLNIGIITKDEKETKGLYEKLKGNIKDLNLIAKNANEYNGGITIMPSYYSKGLEFDTVIVSDKNKYTDSILDTKLLYVAYTRAMHKLYILEK